MELHLRVNRVSNIDVLTYPSFALPLFDVGDSWLVKRYGFCSGLRVNVYSNGYIVRHEDRRCLDYSSYVLGLWFDPWLYVREVSSVFKPIVLAFLELYPGFSLSVSPLDDVAIFTSIVLSRRTDYHVNSVRWLRSIIELYGDIARVAGVNPGELLVKVARSFHLALLPQLISCYLSVRGEALEGAGGARGLFRCNGVGPKTFYSYLLHVLLDTSYAPVDVNLEVFLNNMGFEGSRLKPVKRYCMVYNCSVCPLRDRCIEARLRGGLGRLTGWFQTVAYVHVKRFCRRRACSLCSLRGVCTRSYQLGPL